MVIATGTGTRLLIRPALAAQEEQERQGERAPFRASPYLPLGHWAYDYLNVLIARGRLTALPPLVQPYRRIEIAEAIQKAEAEGRFSVEESAWVTAIKRDLSDEVVTDLARGSAPQEFRLRPQVGAGFKALSHTHRDPLRPQGDARIFPTFEIALSGDAPVIAGAFRARWDNHYLNDPQFPDGRAIEFRECDPIVDRCAYRVEEAYVELQFRYARLFVGRTYRNWGLPGSEGLLLSDYAYSYDHVAYRLGGERLAVTGVFAPFNDLPGDTARFFSSHRLDWRPRENLVVSAGESVVFGGLNRKLELALVNPVGIWEISGRVGSSDRNALGLVEFWWRARPNLVTYGAFLIDNTSVGTGASSALPQYAFAWGLQVPALAPAVALRADLSVVNALAYRSRVGRFENYTIEGLGLARDKADAVIASVAADWFPLAHLILKPRLDVMWRGADDIRQPFPADAFTGRELLFVGDVETTIRPSVGGRWHAGQGELAWDVGLNVIKDEGNAPRGWRAKGVGRVELRLRKEF